MPEEVQEYLVLSTCTGRLVSSTTYNRLKDIEDKYPEWFPRETTHKKIPKEVHEAYLDEKYPNRHKPISWDGKGLLEQMTEYNSSSIDSRSFQEVWNDFVNSYEDVRKKEEEQRKQDKVLWDKHYSKYKLDYRP